MNQASPSPAGQSSVLLVAPTRASMRELAYQLDRHDLHVQIAEDIERAEALAANGVALIVLDAALAGPDLGATCRRLRLADRRRAAPLLLLSAMPSAEQQSRSVAAGAADYLKIPFDALTLAEQILVELALHAQLPPRERPLGPVHAQTLEVNYHAVLAGSPDAVLLYDNDNDCLIDANHNAELLFGRPLEALLQTNLLGLCPPLQPDGRPSLHVIPEKIRQVLAGQIRVFEVACLRGDGRRLDCEIRLVLLSIPGRELVHARVVDLSTRKAAEALRTGQSSLLEMIAKGAPLGDTLDRLMLLIESQSIGVLCSVMLLDDDGRRMHSSSGPSLPAAYMAALEGLEIGPAVGSCGTAMFRREAVVVSDITRDPLWAPYRTLVAEYGLRACWSMPILHQDTVLGSFAMYYRDARNPTPDDMRLIDVAIHIAGIAIGRTRHEQELLRHRAHLEELVSERTSALTRAKEQADLVNEELASALENLSISQEELVRRDKLAALGALVAGIAHELNTPIGNSLVMCTTMAERTRQLQESLAGGLRRSALEAYLEQAIEADTVVLRNLQRAATLVSGFKQIAVDRASSQRRRFGLRQFVAELMLPLCAPLKDSGIAVAQDIDENLELDSYPGPLGQVLSKLFENCLRHGFEGRSAGQITICGRAAGKGEIALSIGDNGIGIAETHLRHIYDPFFTTKLGKGRSGLGLYIAHNIVTGVLGGRIEASSAADGASFTLLLPVMAPPEAHEQGAA
ncbi:signal transduction histidine kinase/PAS domain-containing protein [Oxalobacteraceae bacterium GrIS 1.11]